MRRKTNIYVMIMILLAVSIGIGYAYLQTSLTMIGNVIVRKYEPPRYLYDEIVAQNQENGLMVLDNQASTYVSASTGIDFGDGPSDTNGKGVYVRNETESDTYPIYYYRGAVTNNNVLFANYCWKIVRTTETGGIKLIYNGTPTEGACNNTGEASQIGTSAFNPSRDYNAYVGYMYGTPNSSTYEAEHLSTKESTSSTIKTAIDTWYAANMASYTDKLEDTVWCNDRSFANISWENGTGAGTSWMYYGAYGRVGSGAGSNPTPSLECTNQNDRFTVNATMEGRVNGNGALTYPVALLTADELTLAGQGYNGNSSSSYLTTGQSWWSLSPSDFDGFYAFGFYVRSAGYLDDDRVVNTPYGARPSVSLLHGTQISANGDGSVNSPFVVEAGEKTITIEGNDDVKVDKSMALPGTKILLLSNSGRNSINSFKMNGELIEGSSFTMPEVNVVITEINVTATNSLYEILVNKNKEDGLMVLDNQSSTYVSASTGIDFDVKPSDTNGKGVYVRNGTESSTYPIYYYRGAVTNNNVIFGGFCWKIVRTTETGGIKLIYNGTPTEGACNNTGEASQIGTSAFNTSYNYNAYVGYMYGTPNSSTYDAEHLSTKESTSSTIKTYIDEWYAGNMTGYTSYLEDTIWCNDRSLSSTSSGTGIGSSSVTYYAAYERNYSSSNPSLECVNQNDRFTVNETMEGRVNGNGALTYPVALLTADELTLAGQGYIGYSTTNYLHTGQYWWSLSPYRFNSGYAYEFIVKSGGYLLNGEVNNSYGVRPSVSLLLGTEIESGGDGSVNSPFVVEDGTHKISIEGNDDIKADKSMALPGATITLSSISGENEIASFKLNGQLIEGTSFMMPEEDVVITDITYVRYLYDEIIAQNQENGAMVLDSGASTYVSASTGINFKAAPSDTNGKGVYVRNGTESDTYPIYYYRGAVTNNNVLFANFCWKIVRTTETGGIKLIYNGTPTDGQCNNTGTASQIGTSAFNSSYNYNAYVGYMYGTPNSSTYEAEHLSTKGSTSSTIKVEIDSWFEDNMTGYTSYLEDTVWCNDRSFASSNTGTGAGTSLTYYGAYGRAANSTPAPSLECVNQNDRFTVNATMEGREEGNGALTYPVALLTADELTLAGQGYNGYSSSSYLTTGQYWWSLSPGHFFGGSAREFYVYSVGGLNYGGRVDNPWGVRPSVSLLLGTEIESGGDGSTTNPFVVK